jgi:hypothetical protein
LQIYIRCCGEFWSLIDNQQYFYIVIDFKYLDMRQFAFYLLCSLPIAANPKPEARSRAPKQRGFGFGLGSNLPKPFNNETRVGLRSKWLRWAKPGFTLNISKL